jgi:hypothetical protein
MDMGSASMGRERAQGVRRGSCTGEGVVSRASGKEDGGHGAHQLEDERPVAVELEERDERHEHAANPLHDVRVDLGDRGRGGPHKRVSV